MLFRRGRAWADAGAADVTAFRAADPVAAVALLAIAVARAVSRRVAERPAQAPITETVAVA